MPRNPLTRNSGVFVGRSLDEVLPVILSLFPDSEVDETNEGELVISTGLQVSVNETDENGSNLLEPLTENEDWTRITT